MSAGNLKNAWLDKNKNNQMLEDLDEHLMNAWASDVTFGQFWDSLPDELKEFFSKMKFNSPIENTNGFDVGFYIEE